MLGRLSRKKKHAISSWVVFSSVFVEVIWECISSTRFVWYHFGGNMQGQERLKPRDTEDKISHGTIIVIQSEMIKD